MKFSEIKKQVIEEYDRRHLAVRVRYKALDDFENMLKKLYPELLSDVSNFPIQKEIMRAVYEEYLNNQGKKLSDGALSMINEVYNQLHKADTPLTDYSQE